MTESSSTILLVHVDEELDERVRAIVATDRTPIRPLDVACVDGLAKLRELYELPSSPPRFRLAIVDTGKTGIQDALEVCKYLRARSPAWLRFLIKPAEGVRLPAEFLVEGFPVDGCIADSADRNLERLITQCLQNSHNIETLESFTEQVRDHALRSFSEKYGAEVALVGVLSHDEPDEDGADEVRDGEVPQLSERDVAQRPNVSFSDEPTDAWGARGVKAPLAHLAETALHKVFHQLHRTGIERLRRNGVSWLKTESGDKWGLPPRTYLLPFFFNSHLGEHMTTVRGGVCYRVRARSLTPQQRRDFADDLTLMVENWRLAYSAGWLYEHVVSESAMQAQAYEQQIASMTTVVAGLAHEVNTPLGVANTANSMVSALAEELKERCERGAAVDDISADISEASTLLGTNLDKVSGLVKRFRELSSEQLVGARTETSLLSVVMECVESLKPETQTRGIDVMIDHVEDQDFAWHGYEDHLSRIIINLMQNVMRYAYPDSPGVVMIRLRRNEPGTDLYDYQIELQDYGAGIAASLVPRIFDPFVTTGRGRGGTGLGLAICRTIAVELLKGNISCSSQEGVGTTFVIELPSVVPEADESVRRRADLL